MIKFKQLTNEQKQRIINITKEMTPEKFKEFIYKTDNQILPNLFNTEYENLKSASLSEGPASYRLSTVLKMDNIVHTPDTHPHTKAQNILNQMILHSTKEGDLVFDGFAGSGSIVEACIKTKRNYIAVELDPKWHNLIKQRLEKWTNQQTLF